MFDSGVGGLTVARAVLNQLPGEQILYIGDTAHAPYGPKAIDEVRSLALGVMDELVEAGVKMLVTTRAAAIPRTRASPSSRSSTLPRVPPPVSLAMAASA